MLSFFVSILKSRAQITPPRQFFCIRNGALIPQEPFLRYAFRQPQPPQSSAPLTTNHNADADPPPEPLSPKSQDLQPARGLVARLPTDTDRPCRQQNRTQLAGNP